ncbi:hypothetical protein GQ42DRAFT_81535 [Ramicandelaber brevisporus]|nr:hypothetical protein GQ42DRAFT_81535 [Ramicandelaber brevisporus]
MNAFQQLTGLSPAEVAQRLALMSDDERRALNQLLQQQAQQQQAQQQQQQQQSIAASHPVQSVTSNMSINQAAASQAQATAMSATAAVDASSGQPAQTAAGTAVMQKWMDTIIRTVRSLPMEPLPAERYLQLFFQNLPEAERNNLVGLMQSGNQQVLQIINAVQAQIIQGHLALIQQTQQSAALSTSLSGSSSSTALADAIARPGSPQAATSIASNQSVQSSTMASFNSATWVSNLAITPIQPAFLVTLMDQNEDSFNGFVVRRAQINNVELPTLPFKIKNQEISIKMLFKQVVERGGFAKMSSAAHSWKNVHTQMGLKDASGMTLNIKRFYIKYLQPIEEEFVYPPSLTRTASGAGGSRPSSPHVGPTATVAASLKTSATPPVTSVTSVTSVAENTGSVTPANGNAMSPPDTSSMTSIAATATAAAAAGQSTPSKPVTPTTSILKRKPSDTALAHSESTQQSLPNGVSPALSNATLSAPTTTGTATPAATSAATTAITSSVSNGSVAVKRLKTENMIPTSPLQRKLSDASATSTSTSVVTNQMTAPVNGTDDPFTVQKPVTISFNPIERKIDWFRTVEIESIFPAGSKLHPIPHNSGIYGYVDLYSIVNSLKCDMLMEVNNALNTLLAISIDIKTGSLMLSKCPSLLDALLDLKYTWEYRLYSNKRKKHSTASTSSTEKSKITNKPYMRSSLYTNITETNGIGQSAIEAIQQPSEIILAVMTIIRNLSCIEDNAKLMATSPAFIKSILYPKHSVIDTIEEPILRSINNNDEFGKYLSSGEHALVTDYRKSVLTILCHMMDNGLIIDSGKLMKYIMNYLMWFIGPLRNDKSYLSLFNEGIFNQIRLAHNGYIQTMENLQRTIIKRGQQISPEQLLAQADAYIHSLASEMDRSEPAWWEYTFIATTILQRLLADEQHRTLIASLGTNLCSDLFDVFCGALYPYSILLDYVKPIIAKTLERTADDTAAYIVTFTLRSARHQYRLFCFTSIVEYLAMLTVPRSVSDHILFNGSLACKKPTGDSESHRPFACGSSLHVRPTQSQLQLRLKFLGILCRHRGPFALLSQPTKHASDLVRMSPITNVAGTLVGSSSLAIPAKHLADTLRLLCYNLPSLTGKLPDSDSSNSSNSSNSAQLTSASTSLANGSAALTSNPASGQSPCDIDTGRHIDNSLRSLRTVLSRHRKILRACGVTNFHLDLKTIDQAQRQSILNSHENTASFELPIAIEEWLLSN